MGRGGCQAAQQAAAGEGRNGGYLRAPRQHPPKNGGPTRGARPCFPFAWTVPSCKRPPRTAMSRPRATCTGTLQVRKGSDGGGEARLARARDVGGACGGEVRVCCLSPCPGPRVAVPAPAPTSCRLLLRLSLVFRGRLTPRVPAPCAHSHHALRRAGHGEAGRLPREPPAQERAQHQGEDVAGHQGGGVCARAAGAGGRAVARAVLPWLFPCAPPPPAECGQDGAARVPPRDAGPRGAHS